MEKSMVLNLIPQRRRYQRKRLIRPVKTRFIHRVNIAPLYI